MEALLPKHLVKIVAILGIVTTTTLSAGPARAQTLPPEAEMTAERVLGSKDAPLTLIEYASMTCPHCAAFHNGPYQVIKKEYIDTGKLKLIYRDFPLNNTDLAAMMMARCVPADRYFGVVEIVFKTQSTWLKAQNQTQALGNLARFAQISPATFNACVSNETLLKKIVVSREEGIAKHQVSGTPTLILNGNKINSEMSDAQVREVMDAALAKVKK
jgi:protein-disulfide isomerase